MINKISIEYGKSDLFPVFLDYDFKKMRPRGISSKIAFFTYGYLCDLVDNNKPYNGMLFIKNKTFVFNEGFFLIDYKDLTLDFEKFSERISNTGVTKVYFEDVFDDEFVSKILQKSNFDIYLTEII